MGGLAGFLTAKGTKSGNAKCAEIDCIEICGMGGWAGWGIV